MKTYPITAIRKAFFELVDMGKYHKVSIYCDKKKPLIIKAKISNIFADMFGMNIVFKCVWLKRHRCFNLKIKVKDIRWLSSPFDQQHFEELCQQYVKKIEAPI